ncbi:hypothetical protein [Photobacterium sp. GB-72]|uniref:hypothetical protein n=1 Tax=Photobacterium sp. GB-72 TaxID=2022105 RepID=UPI000D169EC2|nr:hypothetical protein [Photobacterium sp. GB-72]PSV28075.1 hypothetical protein C9J40_19540 [Photobacterium sp. GB-72]
MNELVVISLVFVCYVVPFVLSRGFYNLKDKTTELRTLQMQIKENDRDINDSVNDTNRTLIKVHKP